MTDEEIRTADPAAVILQYDRLVHKLARWYIPALEHTGSIDIDDLVQVGSCVRSSVYVCSAYNRVVSNFYPFRVQF